MSGWGSGLWGASAWGSGSDVPQLLAAQAIRENCVRLTFSEPIRHDRTGGPRDGSRRSLYAITPVAGTQSLTGEAARSVFVGRVDRAGGGGTLLDLWLDRPLTGWPARYLASAFGVWSIADLPIDPSAMSTTFEGTRAGSPPRNPNLDATVIGADVAVPQTPEAAIASRAAGALPGAFAVDVTGDFAIDAGLVSLVKRIYRRLLSEPGAFAHLGPNYGAGLRSSVKRLATPSERARLERLAADQARQEPEVAEAEARLAQVGPNAWVMRLRVRTRFAQDASFDVPVRVGI